MSWGKVCDTLHAHRKVARAGFEAMGLWTAALSWSRDKGTAGHIPADRPALLAADEPDPEATAARAVARLVVARLWDVDPAGGWRFHDWADYQESEAEELDRRARTSVARAEAGRRGGLARVANQANAKQNEANEAKPSPLLSSPLRTLSEDPDPPVVPLAGDPPKADEGEGQDKPAKARRTRTTMAHRPASWMPNEGHYELGAADGLGRAEVLALIPVWADHHLAKGTPIADFDGSFRTWIRNDKKFGGRGRGGGGGHATRSSAQPLGAWRPGSTGEP